MPSRACPALEGLVERAATDEPQSWVSVLGVDRHLTGWTSEDPLRAAVVGRCLDRLLVSRQQLHAVGLDQQVDDEGGTSLSLAVPAVRKERIGRQR
jgi:hypothetical protein